MIKLIDIAEQLNLSRVTVSAVLNDRYKKLGISEATAKRVIKAADEMGYQRNEMAISMKTGKSFLLGCMTGALDLEWGGRIVEGALLGLRNTAYSLKLESVHSSVENEAAVQRFLGARVAGILACNINPNLEDTARLKNDLDRYKIPLVCNNCRDELSPYKVAPDNIRGSLLAVEHLVSLGHNRIAFVGGDQTSDTSIQREKGFLKALGKLNLSLGPNFLERGNWDFVETEKAVKRLLSAKTRPTAIICANDEMAAVALRTIQREGLRVPKDVSVVGFTNERLGLLANPPLTTVAQSEKEVGKAAIKMLIEIVGAGPDRKLNPKSTLLPSRILARESTGPAPK
ncbi:MAG: LacI family DNA-binding transcriptional regulator [Verrucomicrobiota bacterium]